MNHAASLPSHAPYPAPPFAANLVFPDIDADELAREASAHTMASWPDFLARTLGGSARKPLPRLRAV